MDKLEKAIIKICLGLIGLGLIGVIDLLGWWPGIAGASLLVGVAGLLTILTTPK